MPVLFVAPRQEKGLFCCFRWFDDPPYYSFD
jgi:hypothetical protein